MMKKILFCFLFTVCGLLRAEVRELHSDVGFDGTSTLHDFHGAGKLTPQLVEWEPLVEGGVLTAHKITLKVSDLTTDHKKRDRNMMKMFDPESYPQIQADISGWALPGSGSEEKLLTLHIHGTEVTVPVLLSDYEEKEGVIHFTCSFTVSLKEADLKRPSVLGLIRVGDEVKVVVESELTLPEAN